MSRKTGISGKTLSAVQRRLERRALIKMTAVPNLKKLGLEILAVHLIKFNPQKPPDDASREFLVSNHDILAVSRRFEFLKISVYPDYNECEKDKMQAFRYLRQHNYIVDAPLVKTFGLSSSVVLKDFDFAPIVKKIMGI